ncbi:ubiquitin carboxyl-terminal hydrolase [bacterium]|nr:ubiquitin carboxyl-terminal hydrolase [bacterium]
MKKILFLLVIGFACSLIANQKSFCIPVGGLPNVGNSCYMNASLQCLFRIPEVAHLIKSTINDKQDVSFLCQCKEVVEATKRNDNEAVLIRITELFEQVNERLFNNQDKQQEDALDFLIRLIDDIPALQSLFCFSLNTTISCTQCSKVLRSANQIISDLPLDAFQPKTIDGIFCSHCSCSYVTAKKELKLNNYPPYLLVDCEQICGENSSALMSSSNSNQSNFSGYELIGIVLHEGTKQMGHFVAFVKEFSSGQWYLCDDAYVSKLSCRIAQKQASFALKHNQNFPFSPRFFLYAKKY